MKRGAVAFFAGVLFAVGLAVAKMTDPAKVLGFLDVAGAWDPSLAFVMVGAVVVAAIAFRVAARMQRPALDGRFHVPSAHAPVTARLVVGAAVFGVGWGLAGFCPGPAVTALASGRASIAVFVTAMVAGMAIEAQVGRLECWAKRALSDAKRSSSSRREPRRPFSES